MKVGVLTSSRADFSIYLPLLNKLKNNSDFDLKIIAFGTHTSLFYGESINNIIESGFDVDYTIDSMPLTDSPQAIASAIGLTTIHFSEFWKQRKDEFDLVFCLGDRYEMFAAVIAGIPFQVEFAHLHGGERTLGAIDNVFRDCITMASKYHFTSTAENAKRVKLLTESSQNVYNTGALSLDNLSSLEVLSLQEFTNAWGIDLNKPTILVTFHPETVAVSQNKTYAEELIKAINNLPQYQILITMPNADTAGNLIRKTFVENFSNSEHVTLVENLGAKGYFIALKHVSFLLGNTSSGIIEAASFGKYVINLGDRQKGRICGKNVIHVGIDTHSILEAVKAVEKSPRLSNDNIYYSGGAADKIISILKTTFK